LFISRHEKILQERKISHSLKCNKNNKVVDLTVTALVRSSWQDQMQLPIVIRTSKAIGHYSQINPGV